MGVHSSITFLGERPGVQLMKPPKGIGRWLRGQQTASIKSLACLLDVAAEVKTMTPPGLTESPMAASFVREQECRALTFLEALYLS